MSDLTKAVFLSYAREDADAARRIAEALRSSGLEVWFDQNELRGGDAWDAKIRQQIDACALFVPIISQHTQDRSKGYFRLEWKLAVDQTHLLAAGVPFVAPVVIDDTKEGVAVVPPEFMKVQWTRLPGALPTPQFVAQVQRLLDAPKITGGPSSREAAPAASSAASRELSPPKKPAIPGWTWGALTAVVVGIGVALSVSRKPEPVAPPAPAAPVAEAKPALVTIPALNAVKSIAVLPFENLSDDKDSGYFADGIHEEILTNLALIAELRVVSRTSVAQYRATTKPIPQIARELGVGWVLEGSVRRAGNKVRVTGQLIRAASDEHVWAKSYDRDLSDIFAIQSELAQTIAGSLEAAISPREKNLLERRPTENLAAYDLYLKAGEVGRKGLGGPRATWQKAESLYQSAVELDPNFAEAWSGLCGASAVLYSQHYDHSAVQLAKIKAALDQAVRLAPDAPATISSLGNYYYRVFHDYDRALEQYERVTRLQPNSPGSYASIGMVQRRQGRWVESTANLRRVTQLDPGNLGTTSLLIASLLAGRHYDEAIAESRRILALFPGRNGYWGAIADFRASGSTREIEASLARQSAAEAAAPAGIATRKSWAQQTGNLAEAIRLDRFQPYSDGGETTRWQQALAAAFTLAAGGDIAAARTRLENFPAELRARLELDPTDQTLWGGLARMEIVLGHKDEAFRCARKAVELLPESRDAVEGPAYSKILAMVEAWLGDKDRALAELARLLRTPGIDDVAPAITNVYELKFGPEFFPLRGDPRFEALVNDPKNNAPLF